MNLKNLIPWKPHQLSTLSPRERNPLDSFRREMDRLFEDFWGDGKPMRAFRAAEGFWPDVDVKDTDKELNVSVELPGLDEKDVEVLLSQEALTIRGEKREDSEQDKGGYHYAECRYGAFERTIPLPASVEADKVKATFKKGVLRVSLPKTPEAQAEAQRKTIPVQAG